MLVNSTRMMLCSGDCHDPSSLFATTDYCFSCFARGERTTLGSAVLTDKQFLAVTHAFARSFIGTADRAITPPPLDPQISIPSPDAVGSTSSNPWIVDKDDTTSQAESGPTSGMFCYCKDDS